MSQGFSKLFSSLVSSSVWQEPDHVRLVWITMLAMKDLDGIVHAAVPGLAHAARVTLPQTEDALRVLSSPDPYSRTKDYEGRRIGDTDGGWVILNHHKYRDLLDDEDRRAKDAARQAAKRQRDIERDMSRGRRDKASPGVTNPSSHAASRHTDTDTDPEEDLRTLPLGLDPIPAAADLPEKKKRARQLPEGWTPDRGQANREVEREVEARGVDVATELLKLRDWAKGSAAARADWDAVWRGWLRRARGVTAQWRTPPQQQRTNTIAAPIGKPQPFFDPEDAKP